MAIRNTAFLAIEESLTSRLVNAWLKSATPVMQAISALVEKGQFFEAEELVKDLDVGAALRGNSQFLDLSGTQSVLFGASSFHRTARQTSFAQADRRPSAVPIATQTITRVLEENISRLVQRTAEELIEGEKVLQQQRTFQDATKRQRDFKVPFVRDFVEGVTTTARTGIKLGASLHTSRLSQWGFLTEATLVGVSAYKVQEVLDTRTCPVCKRMHGRVFPVDAALVRVDGHLSVGADADALKNIAPFFPQNKGSLFRLDSMTNDQMMENGLMFPPYHPFCRGILKQVRKVAEVDSLRPVSPIISRAPRPLGGRGTGRPTPIDQDEILPAGVPTPPPENRAPVAILPPGPASRPVVAPDGPRAPLPAEVPDVGPAPGVSPDFAAAVAAVIGVESLIDREDFLQEEDEFRSIAP